jgi:hypothetical protein
MSLHQLIILGIGAITLALSGCTSEIKYYDRIKPKLSNNFPWLTEGAFVFGVTTQKIGQDAAKETIGSLSGPGQAEAVKALAAKYSDGDAFLASLVRPLATAAEPQIVIDKSRFKRRILISLVDSPLIEADRISKATVTLTIPNNSRFVSWDRLSTNWETIDLGTLRTKREFKATTDIKSSPIPTTEVGGSVEYGRSIEEEKQLKRKFARSTAVLSPNKAIVSLTGHGETHLTDDVTFDVEIEVQNSQDVPFVLFDVNQLYQSDGRAFPPKQVKLSWQEERYPSVDQLPVIMDARIDFIVRRVLSGNDTVDEGDDLVQFLPCIAGPVQAELLPVTLARPESGISTLQIDGDASMRVQMSGSRNELLQFRTYQRASEVLGWLINAYVDKPGDTQIKIGSQQLLGPGNIPLRKMDLTRLNVNLNTFSSNSPDSKATIVMNPRCTEYKSSWWEWLF